MLKVVAAHVCSTDTDAALFPEDMDAVDDAAAIPYDDLAAELHRLQRGLAQLQSTLSAASAHDPGSLGTPQDSEALHFAREAQVTCSLHHSGLVLSSLVDTHAP